MPDFCTSTLATNSCVSTAPRFIVNLNFIYKVQPLQQSLVVTDGVNFAFQ